MPNYAGTLFFTDQLNSYGWSETYFVNNVTIAGGKTVVENLVGLRSDILSANCKIQAGRISDVLITRDSLLLDGLPLSGQIVATVADTVQPWTALNIRIEATSLNRGRKFLHGVTDDIFLTDRTYNIANPHAAEFTLFFNELVASFRLRVGGLLVPTYEAITNVIPIRETSRRVGRPFGVLVGRRATP